jgi:D-aminoacyl-tRNA deacylase
MRAVVQRVSQAAVQVDGDTVGQIGRGLVVLLGINTVDEEEDADYLCQKVVGLRIFPDLEGKFNLSLQDIGGELLVVSQFTLHGNCRKGRRPSFTEAAGPDKALPLYEYFISRVRNLGVPVATGRFQAIMALQLVNDGPVTLILDSEEQKTKKEGSGAA